jgi:hypothetical protein
VSELPQLERALNEAAHRRYARAWWRPRIPRVIGGVAVAAAVAAVAIVVGAAVLSAVSDTAGRDERPATRDADQWTTTVNKSHGFTVSLPPGWQLSAESLTPDLLDPRELMSAATFPLAYRRGRCNHMPDGALRAMGPADAFVTIQERGGNPRVWPASRLDQHPSAPAPSSAPAMSSPVSAAAQPRSSTGSRSATRTAGSTRWSSSATARRNRLGTRRSRYSIACGSIRPRCPAGSRAPEPAG